MMEADYHDAPDSPGSPASESSFAERMLWARKNALLSQQDVADHLGISRESVHQWETGMAKPKQERLPAICETFGTNLEWLIEGKGEAPGRLVSRSLPWNPSLTVTISDGMAHVPIDQFIELLRRLK